MLDKEIKSPDTFFNALEKNTPIKAIWEKQNTQEKPNSDEHYSYCTFRELATKILNKLIKSEMVFAYAKGYKEGYTSCEKNMEQKK